MQLWKVRALLILDRVDEASALLKPDLTIPDIKEGELSTSFLWFEIGKRRVMAEEGVGEEEALKIAAAKYPLPYLLDFRMHE